jgi:hypothetical protein
MGTLDEAMGGNWWREYFSDGFGTEAVEDVVAEFIRKLARPDVSSPRSQFDATHIISRYTAWFS